MFICAAAHFYLKSFAYPLGWTYRVTGPFQMNNQEVTEIVCITIEVIEKLQKRQIIHADYFRVRKRSLWKKYAQILKVRGNKNIIKVGEYAKCPECSRMGRVVWVSKDGVTAGIQCPANHRQTSRPASKFGTVSRPRSKNSRNMVFITEIEWSALHPFVRSVDAYVKK